MREYLKFYIDGRWVDPVALGIHEVENPVTERVCGTIAIGSSADVDTAVTAARAAFTSWSGSTRADRLDLLQSPHAEHQRRAGDLAEAVTEEAQGIVGCWPQDPDD